MGFKPSTRAVAVMKESVWKKVSKNRYTRGTGQKILGFVGVMVLGGAGGLLALQGNNLRSVQSIILNIEHNTGEGGGVL